ncbi:unnamed protein product [Linum tenue]|uniref:Uncharacterized protein n=1 Tax=Linum tenue TaxID=586396 RepID=A0AAV0IXN3_9ROSI|nr:unnamed protein product [Linum tenue]
MDKKGEISLYRAKLDKSLASPELTDHEALKSLVRDQMLQSRTDESEACSENLVEKRTADVSNFLDMLRSASSSGKEPSKINEPPSGEWKVKDNNQEYRVMYRPGLQGTPFHTLLVEGYVDGPVDACLCIGWESTLYRKWWPQVIMPPFKIAVCKCLKRIRIGEQISLVRVKVAWPLQAREVVIHYVLFEYPKEGVIIVLMNTVPDLEAIDINTHGYTKDGIPEAQDVVRAELVGGFALQKVTPTRSYFRTIATVDLKIDFVPPALINFISRQLIGSGFKLYQKAVTALYKDDEEYIRALDDPFYVRMRDAIYAANSQHQITEGKENIDENDGDECLPDRAHDVAKEEVNEIEEYGSEGSGYLLDGDVIRSAEQRVERSNHSGESMEEDTEPTGQLQNVDKGIIGQPSASTIKIAGKGYIAIKPEVKQALEILERAISMVRKSESNAVVRPSSTTPVTNEETSNLEKGAEEKDSNSTKKDDGLPPDADDSKNGSSCSYARHSTSSVTREYNYKKVAPASPEPFVSNPKQVSSETGNNTVDEAIVMDQIRDDEDDKLASRDVVNGMNENALRNKEGLKKKQRRFALPGSRLQRGKQKQQHRLCCFAPSPGSVK